VEKYDVERERVREIKIYGCDGNIIQFSVFMAHFGRLLPHSTLFLGIFSLRAFFCFVCRMQTLNVEEALKFHSILFMFVSVSNDEITEKLKIAQSLFSSFFVVFFCRCRR
jgi:hypothetical protein